MPRKGSLADVCALGGWATATLRCHRGYSKRKADDKREGERRTSSECGRLPRGRPNDDVFLLRAVALLSSAAFCLNVRSLSSASARPPPVCRTPFPLARARLPAAHGARVFLSPVAGRGGDRRGRRRRRDRRRRCLQCSTTRATANGRQSQSLPKSQTLYLACHIDMSS